MDNSHIIEALTEVGFKTKEEAFTFFDRLQPVSPAFMVGQWKGLEVNSNHFTDGNLTKMGWYGKLILSNMKAYPLLFYDKHKTSVFPIHTDYLFFYVPNIVIRIIRKLSVLLKTKVSTTIPQSKIEELYFREKKSAALVYDNEKAIDYYRKLDENHVCGMMVSTYLKDPIVYLMVRDTTIPLDEDLAESLRK